MILYVFLSSIFWIIIFFWQLPTLIDTDRVHYFILWPRFLSGWSKLSLDGQQGGWGHLSLPLLQSSNCLTRCTFTSPILKNSVPPGISPSIIFYLLQWILEWIIHVTSVTKEHVPCLMSPGCTSSCTFPFFLFTARPMNGWVFCLNLLLCLEFSRSIELHF